MKTCPKCQCVSLTTTENMTGEVLECVNCHYHQILLIPQTPRELVNYFLTGSTVKLCGVVGIIGAIEREDGSGVSFNVRFAGSTKWYYLKLKGKK